MSLEAALAEESKNILRRLDGRPPTVLRGRKSIDRSMSPHGQLRSTSRGRNRGRSSDRRSRGASRARSQGEDVNYKWSILFHDPSDRFINSDDNLDKSGNEDDEDDISEEEQISDDEQEFEYDINDLRLPNYRISINDYYRGKVAKVSQPNNNKNNNKTNTIGASTASKVISSIAKNLNFEKNEERHIKKEGEKLEQLSEVLALEKGLEDAKNLGENVPRETIDEVAKKLNEIGFQGDKLSVNDLVKLENAKDTKYEEYKKTLIDESKDLEIDNTTSQSQSSEVEQEERIVESPLDSNETNLRVSRSITLGKFFTKGLTSSQIRSYLLYMDLSTESINSLQYTLGSVVKSGDVLYIINTVNDEDSIEFYQKQTEKLTSLVKTYMNLIADSNFKLHVVIESISQEYPKHFLNNLIKYLKPSLLIVCYRIIMNELSNYISNIPLMIIKRKAKRRKSAV
ncbi:hypothetical protein BN7_2582 [Wickerhamomyces ciferrii]|uniref:Uncharacterized protein n=1 Tax=Wickerhamomyces ciferrii (strain ATCC 14091 / BCRC 22168 / CBS 111 / JCM 3599 / NBRC 0793 / NRRL Y-1031 F-60-10) TaxID=1206466 RepID=K0KD56_WICCF|nr:uncharacterized protein BN7_2582 [Wickerhamomyces ciferrii]CCH43035.1 hypothetical protein BN7_2582 [Wickerhamomyces ciferrii]